jgi:predicted N-acetyltransferase YhbS
LGRIFDETPVGFAHVEILADGLPHLPEMDVAPDHARCGLGTSLLQRVLDCLAQAGHYQYDLTGHMPWNMPFYARLGFVEIDRRDLRPALEAIVRDEAEPRLDRSRRAVMGYRANPSNPAS